MRSIKAACDFMVRAVAFRSTAREMKTRHTHTRQVRRCVRIIYFSNI